MSAPEDKPQPSTSAMDVYVRLFDEHAECIKNAGRFFARCRSLEKDRHRDYYAEQLAEQYADRANELSAQMAAWREEHGLDR